MIIKAKDCPIEQRPEMRGGNGIVEITSFVSKEELNDKGRLFARISLKPGCSIGWHIHENDCEIFFVERGIANYSDNGTPVVAAAGDVLVCPAGTGHSIANAGEETVDLIALIVYA